MYGARLHEITTTLLLPDEVHIKPTQVFKVITCFTGNKTSLSCNIEQVAALDLHIIHILSN